MTSTTVRSRRATRAAAVLLVAALLALLAGAWWASQQGYVSWSGTVCTNEGYVGPVPSYDELVTERAKSPYCARHLRGETWF